MFAEASTTSSRRSSTAANSHAAALVILKRQRRLTNRAFSVAAPSTRNCLGYLTTSATARALPVCIWT